MHWLLVLLLFGSCAGFDVKKPNDVAVKRDAVTYTAAKIVDAVFARAHFDPVADLIEVHWEDGDVIIGLLGGRLYGEELVRPDFKSCYIRLATRSGIIHLTSLAHEMMHCTIQISNIDRHGDRWHSRRDWWGGLVDAANQELKRQGY